MQSFEYISELIAKELQGVTTPEEAAELQAWRNAGAANEADYRSFVQTWHQSDVRNLSAQYDANAAWKKLNEKIERAAAPVIKMNRRFILTAAASVAAMVIMGLWFFNRSNEAKFTSVTAVNENKSITLPDGSTIVLRKGSTAEWSSSFSSRIIRLKGEALFDVVHDASKPFSVKNLHSTVTVLGTSFDIITDRNADLITVVRGKVSVSAGAKETVLIAGESVQAGTDLSAKTEADINAAAWQTGILKFAETPLNKVLEDVSRTYNKRVITANSIQAEKITVTVQFDKQPFSEVIREIALVTGLSVKSNGDTTILYKK